MDVVKASRYGLGRKRMSKRRDKRVFSKTANKTRIENVMRGGTRL